MSYTPSILINSVELENNKTLNEAKLIGVYDDEETRGGEYQMTVKEYLCKKVLNYSDNTIMGIKYKYIESLETPSFNKNVRNTLDELEIEYVILN